ncbi:MAG: response regulator [Anaerolineales bacterium]
MVDTEKIRVVIVDDISETRENIRKLLQFEPDVEVVGVARTGREAIDISKDVKPDVLLMDINMPDMDGISATEIIRKIVPFTQIVILSRQHDPNYMRRAMLAGARDFLTKPPTIDELTAAIHRAGAMAREERLKIPQVSGVQGTKSGGLQTYGTLGGGGKVVTFYSPKGGSGCTTLATNLAVCLYNEDTSVVIVDGNLQFGDVAVFLNEQGKFSILDLTPRADELDSEIINNVTLKHGQSGIKILAAPMKPEQGDMVTGDQFTKVIRFLRSMFSYVIIDTASALQTITASAIDNSDILVLLTIQDIPSIKNSRLFLDEIDALGFDRKRIIFVMNKFDKRIGITPEKVSENLKQEISAVIPYEERVIVSINRGIPFLLVDKSRPLSRSILSLAEIVRKRISEIESLPEVLLSAKGTGKK